MKSLRKFSLVIALYIALAISGSLSLFFHRFFLIGNATNLLVPVSMMLIALFDDTNHKEIWLAFGTGVVSDIYFFGIIGVYAISLPIICWLLQKAARFLPEVFWARILAILISSILVEGYTWLIMNMTGLTSISSIKLIKSILPTLCWAFIFACVTYKLWWNLAVNYPFMVNLDNYQQ